MNNNSTLVEDKKTQRPVSPRRQSSPMSAGLVGRVIQLRWVKLYAEAHNHLVIGCVLEETTNYIKMECRSIHYRGWGSSAAMGSVAIRVIPWSRIEVIHQLSQNFPWKDKVETDDQGNLRVGCQGPIIIPRNQSNL